MLSKTAEYTLRAVVCLADPPQKPKSVDVVTDRTKVPRSYLNRVLQNLATAGLVQSHPGPGEGNELARAAEKMMILVVVSAVAPIERIRKCPHGPISQAELCPLHRELDQVSVPAEVE